VDGVREVVGRIEEAELASLGGDPDLLTAKAHVAWQSGVTRASELEAAVLATQALVAARSLPKGSAFILRGLARHYVELYLQTGAREGLGAATRGISRAEMERAVAENAAEEFAPFAAAFAYDRLLQELESASTQAWVDMIEAHAAAHAALGAGKTLTPAARKALLRRSECARAVVAAWRKFDEGLQSEPALLGSNQALSAFQLNDVVLVHALWFQLQPSTTDLPPALSCVTRKGCNPDREVPRELRPLLVPMRVAWVRRNAEMLGPRVASVLADQEAERFAWFERETRSFESALVDYLAALPARNGNVTALAFAAARGAAQLGVQATGKEGRVRYADLLMSRLPSPPPPTPALDLQREAIDAAYLLRHVRYL